MRWCPTGKSGAQSITVGFKYEYVSVDKRNPGQYGHPDLRSRLPA